MTEIVVISCFSLLFLFRVTLQISILAAAILGRRSYSTIEQVCSWFRKLGLGLSILCGLRSDTSRVLHLVCIDRDSSQGLLWNFLLLVRIGEARELWEERVGGLSWSQWPQSLILTAFLTTYSHRWLNGTLLGTPLRHMITISWRLLRSLVYGLFTKGTRVSCPSRVLLVALTPSCVIRICSSTTSILTCALTRAVFVVCSDAFWSISSLLLLFSIKQVRILLVNFPSCYAWISDGKARLLERVPLMILWQTVYILIVLCHSLLFKPIKLNRDKLNRLRQILAAVLELTLHLAAAGQVVTDDGFVISIKRVRILGLNHDLICLEKALHASLPFSLILSV